MQTTEAPNFAALMIAVGELYGKILSKPMIQLHWQALSMYSLSDVRTALQAHICNPDSGQFFPKPADLIRQLEGGAETQALKAWTKVESAIEHIGAYQSLAFDDPLIHAVIEEMGGWVKLCTVTLKELPFRSLEFQKRYQGLVPKTHFRYPPYLSGLIEQENVCKGYAAPEPWLVGDPQKIQALIQGGSPRPALCRPPASIQQLSTDIHAIQRAKDPQDG